LTPPSARRGYAVGPALAIGVAGSTSDAADLSRRLGLPETEPPSDPDLVVTFVDEELAVEDLQLLGDDSGFDGERFLVLGRLAGGARANAVHLGEPLELVSSGRARSLPLLLPLLDLAALRKSVLPLHAAVFSFEGRGIAVLGWPHGGKTSALLAFLARGARLVADDRAYVSFDPPHVAGLRGGIELRGHHLEALSSLPHPPGAPVRVRLRLSLGADRLQARAARRAPSGRLSRLGARSAAAIAAATATEVSPRDVVGDAGADVDRIGAAFVMLRQLRGPVRVERLPVASARERLLALAQDDRAQLRELVQKYRFAFPGAASDQLDLVESSEARSIEKLARETAVFAVSHSPASRSEELFEAMAEHCR
jgi:hypothetical protein